MISTLTADPDPHRPPPAVRVSQPPAIDPPYDDEPCEDRRVRTEDRRLRAEDRRGSEPERAPAPIDPPVEPPIAGVAGPGDISAASIPHPSRAAMGYVRLCIEVFNGYRPAQHLRRIGGPVRFDTVVAQLRHRNARAVPATRGRNDGAAHYPGSRVNSRPAPLAIQRLRVSEPQDGIAEAVAVLAGADRAFALALRLERNDGRWICALAQVI